MIDSCHSTFIAVSDALFNRHPAVHATLWAHLQGEDVRYFPIRGAKNIWVRDHLPVQTPQGFIKFRYGYGDDNPQFEGLKTSADNWSWLLNVRNSRIRLDGGNIVRAGGAVIMTDIIFRHNPGRNKLSLERELEKIFRRSLVVVPAEPQDDIGHTDGIAHYSPETRTLLVNDYARNKTREYDRYFIRLLVALSGFHISLFPYAYHRCPKMKERAFRRQYPNADTFNPGFGYYINLMRVKNLVFLPRFGIPEDREALEMAEQHFPSCKIVPVHCRGLSMEGGLVNCVTMDYCM